VLLEAAGERLPSPLRRFVFASSAAVYGPRSLYPGPLVHENDTLQPPNRYGVWKLAGEHLCRLFAQRSGVPTVCLRLNTTYGKGRDRGRTGGADDRDEARRRGWQRAGNRSRCRIAPRELPLRRGRRRQLRDRRDGSVRRLLGLFNIRGTTVEVASFLALIEQVAAELGIASTCKLTIASDATENLFVSDLDDRAIQARFPHLPFTAARRGRAALAARVPAAQLGGWREST
jgi:nucleoside-diphosphate-sugar epimerase